MRHAGRWIVPGLLTALLVRPAPLASQAAWTFRTRAVATGSSDRSEPTGYKVYTAFTWEAALGRTVSGPLAIELSARTESHEVDRAQAPGPDVRLGSLELLPVNLLLQYRLPFHGRIAPYVGAGGNATLTWEKSGALDSDGFSPSFGPAFEVGADVALGTPVALNVAFRWNTMRTVRSVGGTDVATLKIDPAALALGFTFRW